MIARRMVALGLVALVWTTCLREGIARQSPADKYWLGIRKKVTRDHNKLHYQFQGWYQALCAHLHHIETKTSKETTDKLVIKNALDYFAANRLKTKPALLKDLLKATSKHDLEKIDKARIQARDVADCIAKLRGILLEDKELALYRRDRKEVDAFLKQLHDLIAAQKAVQEKMATEDTPALQKRQDFLTNQCDQLAKEVGSRDRSAGKLLLKAAGHQKQAQRNIRAESKKEAIKVQARVLGLLAEAHKALVARQKKKRTEQVVYLGSVLSYQCKQLLDQQRKVQAATLALAKATNTTKDNKPTRAHRQEAARLAEKQKRIIRQATKCISALEADGSAIAFVEVFVQVRVDMQTVLALLNKCELGKEIQVIQQDIVETLEDMIKALEKTWGNRKGKSSSLPIQEQKPSQALTKLTESLEEMEEDYRERVLKPLRSVQDYLGSLKELHQDSQENK